MACLRLLWLDSDAYPRLSWSSALLTDEGFYIHNARNVALFGHARTDEFNNMLIMPLLHLVQVGVFALFGAGAIQARLVSVVSSLLAIWLFYAVVRRLMGKSLAQVGTVLLGLDHVFMLYNRLALMDTPAVLPAMGAFYAFLRAAECAASRNKTVSKTEFITKERDRAVVIELPGPAEHLAEGSPDEGVVPGKTGDAIWWLVVCGLLLIASYGVRGLTALMIPAPFVAWWIYLPRQRRSLGFLGLGLLLGGAVFLSVWYWPHHQELSRVNHYYVGVQLLPHSFTQLQANVRVALFHWERGEFPFLLKHTPLLLCLALVGCWPGVSREASAADQCGILLQSALLFCRFWFLSLILFCAVVNYAPSRYFVLFYPPMTLLALATLQNLWQRQRHSNRFRQQLLVAALLVFVIVNGGWLADWSLHRTYRQREADHWLAVNLPVNSVLFGAVTPGLCLNNHFQVVNVMEGFCNDRRPLERFPNVPRYILILDSNAHNTIWRERWWDRHYPDDVTPERKIHTFPRLLRDFFVIGVYDASDVATNTTTSRANP